MSQARPTSCPPSPFRRPRLRSTILAAVGLIALLFAAPAWGYIVFLKDGEQINTKEAPRIEGDTAHLVLLSGLATTMPASEIDLEKTQELNAGINLGSAKLIEGREVTALSTDSRFEDEEQTLGELITTRPGGLTLPEVRRRRPAVGEETEEIPYTQAGFVDLVEVRRRPFPSAEIITELQRYLQGQGIEGARIYQGTEPDRVLIEVTANSEASVFKVLKDASSALVQVNGQFPDQVAALELLLMTEAQIRAGQFFLTPDLANMLVSGRLDAPTFFYRHVEF